MQILDGKQTSLDIQQEIAQEVQVLVDEGKKKPHLAAIWLATMELVKLMWVLK